MPVGRRMRCLIALFSMGGPPAVAETIEETLRLPSDASADHLFIENPAVPEPKGVRVGAVGVHNSRDSVMDHLSAGGSKMESQVNDDFIGVAMAADLGAGAGIGLEQQVQYHKVSTTQDTGAVGNPVTEVAMNQETDVKLQVELLTGLEAAVSVRYLQKQVTIVGETNTDPGLTTTYKATIFGFGTGFAYNNKNYGFSYTYDPPLHGKTVIFGQEEIIVEPGFIALDGYWKPLPALTLAVMGERWINELDDLDAGTTASDNKTNISLYGLDPDQYLVRDQLVMVGGDYAFNKLAAVRFGLGQEKDHFDFTNLFVYNGIGVQNQGSTDTVTTLLGRVALHVSNLGVSADGGLAFFKRNYSFSAAEGSGSYSASGEQLFVTVALKL